MGKKLKSVSPIKRVGKISIDSSMISTRNCNVKSSRAVEYIVLHYTGNGHKDTAKDNAAYFKSADVKASAHYFVDNTSIYQGVALRNVAWHCGGTRYYHSKCRNTNSIGIEMCCTSGNYKVGAKAIENAAQLTAALCKELSITSNDVSTYVIRHYDVTHKQCPKQMSGSNNAEWAAFITRVKEILNAKTSSDAIVDEDLNDTPTVDTCTLPYTVRVTISDLHIRKGPGTNYSKTGKDTGKGVFIIVDESVGAGSDKGWGLLKSYAANRNGWISLDYATKI